MQHSSVSGTLTAPDSPDATICNTSYGTRTGDAIISQDTNPYANLIYAGAADFKCAGPKPGRTISTVTVWGSGGISPMQFNITVYKTVNVADGAGRQPKDRRVSQQPKPRCSTTGTGTITGHDAASGQDEWTIPLDFPCLAENNKTDWLEVQAALDISVGTWYWAAQSEVGGTFDADWRDKYNSSGTNCITYSLLVPIPDKGGDALLQDCVFGQGQDFGDHDFMFTIS